MDHAYDEEKDDGDNEEEGQNSTVRAIIAHRVSRVERSVLPSNERVDVRLCRRGCERSTHRIGSQRLVSVRTAITSDLGFFIVRIAVTCDWSVIVR